MNEYLMERHTDEADACFYGECECCNEFNDYCIKKGDDDNG